MKPSESTITIASGADSRTLASRVDDSMNGSDGSSVHDTRSRCATRIQDRARLFDRRLLLERVLLPDHVPWKVCRRLREPPMPRARPQPHAWTHDASRAFRGMDDPARPSSRQGVPRVISRKVTIPGTVILA